MRDLAKRVQQDNNVAASTESHMPCYMDDDVDVIEQVYRNGRVEETEAVDEVDKDILRVLNSGENGHGNKNSLDGDGWSNIHYNSRTVITPTSG